MRSHTHMRGQSRENILSCIGICRFALDLSKKRKFNVGGDRGSYGGHWKSKGGTGTRNKSEGQNHGICAGCIGRRYGLVGGRQDGMNSGGGDALGGNGNNTNLLHQDGQRMWGGSQNYQEGGRLE